MNDEPMHSEHKSLYGKLLDALNRLDERFYNTKDSCSLDINKLKNQLNSDIGLLNSISGNSSKLSSLSSEKKQKNVVLALNELISNIKEKIVQNQNENSETLLSLQKASSNFQIVVEPVKNFTNNLSKIQAIIEKIQLTNKTYNKNVKGFAAEETQKIEKVISKIKGVCPVLEENIFQIKTHNDELYKQLSDINDQYTPKIYCLLDKAFSSLELLNKQLASINHSEKSNHSLLEDVKNRAGSLITNIENFNLLFQQFNQYQAYFRNSIEFYGENRGNGNGHPHVDKEGREIKKLLSILEYRIAQLLVISNKTGKINVQSLNKYSDILKNLSKLQENYSSLLTGDDRYPLTYKQAIELLRDIIDQCSVYIERYNEFNNDIKAEVKVAKQLYDLFLDVDLMDNSIEQMIIQKITSENFLNNPEDSIAKEAQEILKLYADNHFEKSRFKKIFESSIEELVNSKNIKTTAFLSYKGLPPLAEMVDSLIDFHIDLKNDILSINEKYQLNFELIKKAGISFKESSVYLKCFNGFIVINDELLKEIGKIYDNVLASEERGSLKMKNQMSMEDVKKHYYLMFKNLIKDKEVFQDFANLTGN